MAVPLDVPGLATVLAVGIILVMGGLTFTLARLLTERHEALALRCPESEMLTFVVVHRAVDGNIDAVAHCARWRARGNASCDQGCLRLAA